MNKKFLIILITLVLVGGGVFLANKKFTSKKQTVNFKQAEEKTTAPSYPKATIDEEKCGKDAFYVGEKSADFVKNYCRFLKDNGWRLVHQDYPTCEDIKSFGGGYNYEKGQEKIAVSVIKYGDDATCFWVYKK